MSEQPPAGLLRASAVTIGVLEVVDFIVPLWAGTRLQASPAVAGALLAVQTVGALVGRPIAGELVERGYRRGPAITAILLLVVGMCGYAFTQTVAFAFAAAVLTGLGAALYEIPVMATVADSGGSQRGYGQLLSYEARGSLMAFVATFAVISHISERDLFLGFAVVLLAAALLLRQVHFPTPAPSCRAGPSPARHLAPLLALVTMTTATRSGVLLLAMLGLQRRFDLSILQVGLVLGPGFLVFVVASSLGHRVTSAVGSQRAMWLGLGTIAGMAAC